ncbi:MAG TPA: biopolymer transporter ExbD [Longimicrobium sp.]|nr:biopolymer transporter ExbD [Longimicrobium sp.]
MSAWRRSPLPRLAGFDGEPRGEISVDPMVALALVLLIIVMVVAPSHTGHPKLPRAAHSAVIPKRGITVGVDERGKYWLNDRPVRDGDLRDGVRRAFAARPDESTLYLLASDEVSYARVLGVVDAARSAGVRRLGLLVEAPR